VIDVVATGVMTGVITSALLYAAVEFFRRVVVPWYAGLIYSGVEIAGEWVSESAPFANQTIRLSLRQQANQLTGVVTYQNQDNENGAKEAVRVFRASGDISDRFVCLRLRYKGRRRIGIVHYLIEVVGDGRAMRGFATYYDLVAEKIASGPVMFRQVSAEPLHD